MPVTTDVRTEALAKVPMFRSLHRRSLVKLARIADELHAHAGDDLCQQGDHGAWAFVLVEPHAEVIVDGQVVATLEPGDLCGELSLLDGGPRAATIRLTTEGTVLLVPRDGFLDLLESSPEIVGSILHSLGDRLRAANSLGAEGIARGG